MGYAYPAVEGVTFNGDVQTVHRFLKDQKSVARRVADLSAMRFIADRLLSQRFTTDNGSLTIEADSGVGTLDKTRVVTPLGDYPLTTIGGGTASVVQTDKRGHDTEVADESISRQKINPVERGLTRLVEQNVIDFDSAALSAISTAVTREVAATATFTTASLEQILDDIFTNAARIETVGDLGFNADVAVMKPLLFAKLKAKLLAANYIPDATRAAVLAGTAFPNVEGITFLPSKWATDGRVLIADSTALGGILTENLTSPGYSRSDTSGYAVGVETKVMRLEERDGYRLRARRVAAPVILEPSAALELTGVGTVAE